MEKKDYEGLEMEVIIFEAEDIITTSGKDLIDGYEDLLGL